MGNCTWGFFLNFKFMVIQSCKIWSNIRIRRYLSTSSQIYDLTHVLTKKLGRTLHFYNTDENTSKRIDGRNLNVLGLRPNQMYPRKILSMMNISVCYNRIGSKEFPAINSKSKYFILILSIWDKIKLIQVNWRQFKWI